MAFKFRSALVITLLGLFGLFLPSESLATSCTAVAGNLVANCGFETGFSSWTTVPASNGSFLLIAQVPHSGVFAAGFGAFGQQNDYIYQNLGTTAGTLYDVNFWLDASNGDANNQFVASWNGVNFFTLPGTVPGGYMDYNFLLPATSASTQLKFGGQNQPNASFTLLDDISVVSTTPEPASIILFSTGLLGIVVLLRKGLLG